MYTDPNTVLVNDTNMDVMLFPSDFDCSVNIFDFITSIESTPPLPFSPDFDCSLNIFDLITSLESTPPLAATNLSTSDILAYTSSLDSDVPSTSSQSEEALLNISKPLIINYRRRNRYKLNNREMISQFINIPDCLSERRQNMAVPTRTRPTDGLTGNWRHFYNPSYYSQEIQLEAISAYLDRISPLP
jgi:hypothetical protein